MKDNKDKAKEKDDLKIKQASNVTSSAMQETVQRYGSAVKEHFVAYSGVDNETGKVLTRGLKSIAESKVNPNYEYQNLKQQAGFSAEIKETARENAERIINRDEIRVSRTDDLGRVNDPLYDHVELDAKGNIIAGSGSQMKFVGKSPTDCLDKLMSSKYQKYRDNNVAFEVPSDFYDEIQQEIDNRVKSLKQQQNTAQKNGNFKLAKQQQEKINELTKTKQNMKKSHVSNKEAMEARTSAKVSTFKDIHNVSHRAGIEGAKAGAVIGGGIAVVQNAVAVIRGKKDLESAVIDTAKTTGSSAAIGYISTYGSTALKGYMQNSSTALIRSLSKTNMPVAVVTTAIQSVNSIKQWISGDISGTECLTKIGKNGAATVSSMAYGTAGQILIPIPIVGAVIGSMVGYTLSSMCYGGLVQALNEAKLAKEERIRIEKECEEAITAIRAYRQEMNTLMDSYFTEYNTAFNQAFSDIKSALSIGDVDGFIDGVNQITRKLGGQVEFNTMKEFESRMEDDTPFVL